MKNKEITRKRGGSKGEGTAAIEMAQRGREGEGGRPPGGGGKSGRPENGHGAGRGRRKSHGHGGRRRWETKGFGRPNGTLKRSFS